jgi:RNA polymerase sigma-70 factor (ECF subfamily)
LTNNLYDTKDSSYKYFRDLIPRTTEAAAEIKETTFNLSEENSFTDIYNKLCPYAFYFAKKLVSVEDAADIVASVFCNLWSQQKSFENIHSLKAYIRFSVRNACISHIRHETSRMRRDRNASREIYDQEIECASFAEEAIGEKLHLIYEEIEKLPHRCKDVFKMAFLDRLKNKEIAMRLGINIRTVQNHKFAALKMLRMTLLTLVILLFHTGLLFFFAR